MLKKTFAVIISIVMTINLISCSKNNYSLHEFTPETNSKINGIEIVKPNYFNNIDDKKVSYQSIKSASFTSSKYYEKINEQCAYDRLNSKYKDYYDKLYASIFYVSNSTNENNRFYISKVTFKNIKISERDLMMIIESIKFDHPEIFWLDTSFGYCYLNNTTLIQLFSLVSPNDIKTSLKFLSDRVSEIISSIPGGLSEFKREQIIHDNILSLCSYSSNVKNINDSWQEFSAFGALCYGRAVCMGYTNAFQLIAELLGIHTHKIFGVANNELHSWNIVKLNGIWYHLDLTWNDTENEITKYKYFNVTDNIIKKSHEISPLYDKLSNKDFYKNTKNSFNLFLENCNSLEENYYTKNSPVITNFSPENDIIITAWLVNAITNKQKVFSIKVNDNLSIDDTVDYLFYDEPYKFFYYISEANKTLQNPYQNTKFKFYKDTEQNIIHIVIF